MVTSTDTLPYPDPSFNGSIKPTAAESQTDWPAAVTPPEGAPNVLLIMTDDVGFGAANTTGGPIDTGTMTALKDEGMLFNRFHTTALCSPTRASLLTGRLPHNANTGMIESQATGFPGYNSIISKSCGTVAEYLRYNGYNTAWFGKNHNTPEYETSSVGPFDRWPTGMGFEHFYGFLSGDTDQYHPNLWRDTVPIQADQGKKDYHLDSDLADQAIDYIKKQNALCPDRPFFVYYAPGATHAPHQVPEEFVKRYHGRFDHGWDEQRRRTWEQQIADGIIPENTKLTPRPDNLPAWDDMRPDQKTIFARMMEVYAGYLEFTDYNIGRVVKCIDELGKKDDTLVIYIQGDNGGSAEGTLHGSTNELTTLGNGLPESWEKIVESAGGLGSEMYYNHFPVQWSWAMNSPMQWTKRYASHFGGTRNGMVMRWPSKIPAKSHSRQFHHVCDIMPTILEACNIRFPVSTINGHKQRELDGISMVYCWDINNAQTEGRTVQIFEMAGNRGMYKDGWMLCTTPQVFTWVTSPTELKPEDFSWELYNLDDDFSQGVDFLKGDVSPENVERAEALKTLWWKLAEENNILPLAFTASETRKGEVGRPDLLGDRAYCEFPNGITRLPEKCAPDLKNKSFNITATVCVSASGTEGIIMTLGGRHGGYGLVMFDNKPTWIYKATNDEKYWYRIDWPDALESGVQHDISVSFDYKGGETLGGPGLFTMTVKPHAGAEDVLKEAGLKTMTAEAELTVPAEFSNSDTFNVGSGTGTPLMEEFADKMPFAFTGELVKVAITADNSKMTPDMKKRIRIAQKEFHTATD